MRNVQNNPRQRQTNPPNCQGLAFATLAYGAAAAEDAAGNLYSEVLDFNKAAAPYIGAQTYTILKAIGEPTLGLLAGEAVESGVFEVSAASLTLYLAYQGIDAAQDFYAEQSQNCN